MYDNLLESLLEKQTVTIKANVVVTTLRKGINKELEEYLLSCTLIDMDMPEYHITIKTLAPFHYQLDLVEGSLEGANLFSQKFKFEIVEALDAQVPTDLGEPKVSEKNNNSNAGDN